MKYEIGPWMEYEGVPMFDIPHLRVTPLCMAYIGVRAISFLLEEIAPFDKMTEAEQEQADAFVALWLHLAEHIQRKRRSPGGIHHLILQDSFFEAERCTENGRSIEDLFSRRWGHA